MIQIFFIVKHYKELNSFNNEIQLMNSSVTKQIQSNKFSVTIAKNFFSEFPLFIYQIPIHFSFNLTKQLNEDN